MILSFGKMSGISKKRLEHRVRSPPQATSKKRKEGTCMLLKSSIFICCAAWLWTIYTWNISSLCIVFMCCFFLTYMVLSRCQNKDTKILSYYDAYHVCYDCWLQETLHFHAKKEEEHEEFCSSSETTTSGTDWKENLQDSEETCPTSQQSLLKNRPLLSSIIVYCVFQLHDMAYSEVIEPFISI